MLTKGSDKISAMGSIEHEHELVRHIDDSLPVGFHDVGNLSEFELTRYGLKATSDINLDDGETDEIRTGTLIVMDRGKSTGYIKNGSEPSLNYHPGTAIEIIKPLFGIGIYGTIIINPYMVQQTKDCRPVVFRDVHPTVHRVFEDLVDITNNPKDVRVTDMVCDPHRIDLPAKEQAAVIAWVHSIPIGQQLTGFDMALLKECKGGIERLLRSGR